jgi:hypothetical protein
MGFSSEARILLIFMFWNVDFKKSRRSGLIGQKGVKCHGYQKEIGPQKM